MAEESLTNKIASAISKVGYTYTTDQLDSLKADAIRMFSQYIPQLVKDTTSVVGDGSDTSFNLPALFVDLWIDGKNTATGVQIYTTTAGETSASDLDPSEFLISYGITATLDFFTAPLSGTTGRIWYKGTWAVDGSTLPRRYDRAIVLLCLHYALAQSKALGGEVDQQQEGSVSVQYKSGSGNSQSAASDYFSLAMQEIRSLMNAQNAKLSFGIIQPIRG